MVRPLAKLLIVTEPEAIAVDVTAPEPIRLAVIAPLAILTVKSLEPSYIVPLFPVRPVPIVSLPDVEAPPAPVAFIV